MSSHKTQKNSNYQTKKRVSAKSLVEPNFKKNKRRYAKNTILCLGVLAGCMFICAAMQWVQKSYAYMFTYAAIGGAALIILAIVKRCTSGGDE